MLIDFFYTLRAAKLPVSSKVKYSRTDTGSLAARRV